ncbi:MAG: beta-galactosidase [Mediterranea sp.]|jgi:hypothetical protein|nr:beta-galactosidase [Mediterranea sp.]
MKKLFLLLLLLCGSSLCASAQATLDISSRWDSLRTLLNPDKGWYHHYMDNSVTSYKLQSDAELDTFPNVHHLFVRIAWAYVEPQEGKFSWQTIDTIVARYVPMGYKISLDISCMETYGKRMPYATPQWVEEAGAKGQMVSADGVPGNWEPPYDNPIFLEKLNNFHRAMAARYDGAEWLQDVTTGSIGPWGEGHSPHNVRAGVVIKHLNILLANWKHTQINIGDDYLRAGKTREETLEIRQFVKAHKIGYRDDSIFWEGVMRFPGSVQNPSFFEDVYRDVPTTLETCHYNYTRKQGCWNLPDGQGGGLDTLRSAIRIEHSTFVSMHGHLRDIQRENPKAVWELLNLMGYWLFPQTLQAQLDDHKLNIGLTWVNKGVAPAYTPYKLKFVLVGTDNVRHELPAVEAGNRAWLPGTSKAAYTLHAKRLKPGKYIVEMTLYKTFRDGHTQPIRLGLKQVYERSDGAYRLGRISL